jgi:hypothetical protein
MYTHNPFTIVNYPELLDKQRLLPLSLVSAKVTGSREEPLDHHVLTALPGGQQLPLMAPAAPDPGQVAGAVAGYRALREFREGLYRCLTARPDAPFELTDAILCADHAVTSLVQLSLVPEFRRGHGALYDALAAGRIDEDKLAALLTGTLPQLVDGQDGRAWVAEHDQIGYGLLQAALAGAPAEAAAQVRDACARWRRLRFAIDATPYPRPDAECSPGRGHVHHDACRCDGTRKTIPGWEYQFAAALGQLRTAWTALVDVERTTAATRTRATIRQVKNLIRPRSSSPLTAPAGDRPVRACQQDPAAAGDPAACQPDLARVRAVAAAAAAGRLRAPALARATGRNHRVTTLTISPDSPGPGCPGRRGAARLGAGRPARLATAVLS